MSVSQITSHNMLHVQWKCLQYISSITSLHYQLGNHVNRTFKGCSPDVLWKYVNNNLRENKKLSFKANWYIAQRFSWYLLRTREPNLNIPRKCSKTLLKSTCKLVALMILNATQVFLVLLDYTYSHHISLALRNISFM